MNPQLEPQIFHLHTDLSSATVGEIKTVYKDNGINIFSFSFPSTSSITSNKTNKYSYLVSR